MEGTGEIDLLNRRKFYSERVPKSILPIAYAEGGNLVCLPILPESFGKVFFWDHELEASDGEPATWENLFKVADPFEEFFQNIGFFLCATQDDKVICVTHHLQFCSC